MLQKALVEARASPHLLRTHFFGSGKIGCRVMFVCCCKTPHRASSPKPETGNLPIGPKVVPFEDYIIEF